jgi:hypothetical protein
VGNATGSPKGSSQHRRSLFRLDGDESYARSKCGQRMNSLLSANRCSIDLLKLLQEMSLSKACLDRFDTRASNRQSGSMKTVFDETEDVEANQMKDEKHYVLSSISPKAIGVSMEYL